MWRVIDFYQTLTADSVGALGTVYAADATFKDPFNDVRGIDAIHEILAKMFDDVVDPRFVIRDAVSSHESAFLTWDFTFRVKRWKPAVVRRIRGATQVRFDAAGKVVAHRDYWDAAEELYEKLPVIGTLMRWLKSRLG